MTDPINDGSNPKAIPGAVVRYTVDVANEGLGSPDSNSMVITDPLPTDTALFVDTSGGGPPHTYIPVPDAQGFDPVVTGYRINPTGVMNPTVGSNVPSFSIEFRVRIE